MPSGAQFLLDNYMSFPYELPWKRLTHLMSHNPIKTSFFDLVSIDYISKTSLLKKKHKKPQLLLLFTETEIRQENQWEQNKITFALVHQNIIIHSLFPRVESSLNQNTRITINPIRYIL